MKLSIIIPLHNEAANIQPLLLSLTHTLDFHYKDQYELVLVNDNSTDSTPSLIESYKSIYPQIKPVHRNHSKGFGNAVKSGLQASEGQILIIFMGDLSDDPSTIPRMTNAISQGYDIAYGSRFTEHGKAIDYPITKLISNRIFNNCVKLLFKMPHSDYSNAFKAYRREVIDAIGINNLESSGFDLTIELPLKAHILNFKSIEVPTTWSNRKSGKANLKLSQNATKYGIRLLKLYIDLLNKTNILMNNQEIDILKSTINQTQNIEGDIAEVGVYKGGSATVICQNKKEKTLYLFDTFNGLPYSDGIYKKGEYKSNYFFVKNTLRNYQNVFIYKGTFPETSEPIKNKKFSMVHLDVDIYHSTIDSLNFFYPRMSVGGIILIHDYTYSKRVADAVNEFFKDKPEQVIPLGNQCKIIKL